MHLLHENTIIHGRYKVLRPLGQGGMATTYLVEDRATNKEVALKLLGVHTTSLIESFRQEFSFLTRTRHPHLSRIHDFGSAKLEDGADVLYYTADFIDGVDLASYARSRSSVQWEELVEPVADLSAALAFLHGAGIRHGDVKPENVLVTSSGQAVLIDLGCSRHFGRNETGTISGTPAYMAPELLEGVEADQRADLYALGVTLSALVTELSDLPPPEVLRLIERLTSSVAADRPADAEEVLDILEVERAASPGAVGSPLLGRTEELGRISRILDGLQDGVPGNRTIWIVGPSGVGRSRLLQEIKWTCQLRGAVSEGFAYEPAAVEALLGRAACLGELPTGISGLLEALDRLRVLDEPVTLLMDDVDRLADGQRALLEALARSLEPADKLIFIGTSHTPPVESSTSLVIELEPLGPEDVSHWTSPYLSTRAINSLQRLTAGMPALIDRFLSDLRAGRLSERELQELRATDELQFVQRTRSSGLSAPGQRALALICLLGGVADESYMEALEVPPDALTALLESRLVVLDGDAWRLTRVEEAISLCESFDEDLLQELRLGLASELERRLASLTSTQRTARSEISARLVGIYTASGQLEAAKELLESSNSEFPLSPREWSRAIELFAASSRDTDIVLTHARLLAESGDPDIALRILAGLEVRDANGGNLPGLELELARCHLKLGDAESCIRQLGGTEDRQRFGTRAAARDDILARALVQKGDYKNARLIAERALVEVEEADERLRAALHEDVGVAASYLGEWNTAKDWLAKAAKLATRSGTGPRDQIRLLSYEAINEYRRGNTAGAAAAYAKSLELAEKEGLNDHVASSALNLGTACHQLGDWGRALGCYEKGLRMAVALGSSSTAIIIRFDIAQLHGDIGAFDRARTLLTKVEQMVRREGPLSLEPAIESLKAELLLQKGELGLELTTALDEAVRLFTAQGAKREIAEVELQRARLARTTGDDALAKASLERAAAIAAETKAADLLARVGLERGKHLLDEGRGEEALREMTAAREQGRQTEQRALRAEVDTALAEAYAAQGASSLARRHEALASESLERMAMSLPATLRDTFWRHPQRRRDTDPSPPVPAVSSQDGEATAKLLRLLEINRKLSSSLETKDVLRLTMDAAIELTGAERGFLILVRPDRTGADSIHVPIARNLDREKIGRSHLKFSQSIAQRVIETGEPLLTVDALQDSRFRQQASVHAMRLRSVISVPVRAPDCVLGALYLDNRFQRGRFKEEDLGLLMAFADQAAIALINARLVADLEERTRQLEIERQRIEAMVQSQAVQIDKLTEDLRTRTNRSGGFRHDYSNIVGGSQAMADVLSLVDRITDSPFPVLIQGESGTGKELIATAIHKNGPRKGPFVTVNCAALPETLLESELFGHVRGAFTGAVNDRAGLFVEARDGTLFLDEVGEMPLGMQAKLLRVLQEQEVRPLGTERVISVDVRIITATNRKLKDEVESGRFREDLYYRVAVVEIPLPALRERVEDIAALSRHILTALAEEMGRPEPTLTPRARAKLARHDWPGNVRQLRNVLSKALVLTESDQITEHDIELPGKKPRRRVVNRGEFERDEAASIQAALERYRWNVSEVSRDLGIPRTTLYRKLKKYGLIAG